MLLMNLTEEENLNRVSLLIDTGFVRFLYTAMFEQVQGSTNCAHGDERAYNVHGKRFSRARIYVHVNQSKHLKVVLRCYLR